jgi:hypothetical protein
MGAGWGTGPFVTFFLPGLAMNCNHPKFASQIAGITDVSQHLWPEKINILN